MDLKTSYCLVLAIVYKTTIGVYFIPSWMIWKVHIVRFITWRQYWGLPDYLFCLFDSCTWPLSGLQITWSLFTVRMKVFNYGCKLLNGSSLKIKNLEVVRDLKKCSQICLHITVNRFEFLTSMTNFENRHSTSLVVEHLIFASLQNLPRQNTRPRTKVEYVAFH